MKDVILFTIYTAIALVIVTFILNILYKLKEKKNWIQNLAKFIYNYSYLVLIAISAGFMIFDEIYNTNGQYINEKISDILYSLSKALFSIGAFSGAIKYASSLKLFKEQYKRIVMSDEFSNLLGNKLDAFAHSTDYLEKLDIHQLKGLWQDVTLTKYKNSFPAIYDDLKDNLENELFLKANTSFYYKHFYVEYDINLDKEHDNIINVTYTTNYTIVRNDEKEFEWTFYKNTHEDNYESAKISTIINIDGSKIYDSKEAKYKKSQDSDVIDDNQIYLKCTEKLSGKKQYNVKKVTTYNQDLTIDKALGFGSGRIIDDLFVTIKYCDKLDVFFSRVNKNVFDGSEDKTNRVLKYENRKLLLPGEKFIIFLLRPGK
ncbi:hypothetical protein [uncultured Christiangramia sp.]|uniref:hypothetical protein n=1 Tax=uncultured Christiangramia sp. TaxID=503836 RepID=UPI002607A518|nr:hypothetical protein [uncultured Christiangramia sp.]